MPYLKRTDPPQAKLKRLLDGYGLSTTRISMILECSYGKAKARHERPETFTLEELHRISRYQHIPCDEIREAILF